MSTDQPSPGETLNLTSSAYDLNASGLATNQASTTIEAEDPTYQDDDDGYASDTKSNATESVSSSIRDYAFEHGRRYHKYKEGHYVFPNDESEQEREEMKHAMIVNLCGGKLHFAPIGDNPQKIVDLGTGRGMWCIDMGDEYPSAEILGIDLSPIQPNWVPPNVKFMVDDVEAPWLEPPDFYDFVHARHVTQAFKDFPKMIRNAYKHIKPGGWIELQEMHHLPHSDLVPLPPTSPLTTFFTLATAGLLNLGISLDSSLQSASSLSSYGFINVSHTLLKIPIGTWPKNPLLKKIGLYGKVGIADGLQAMAYGPICRGLGWSREEVEVMLVDVRKYLQEVNREQVYLPFHVFWGQKPFA